MRKDIDLSKAVRKSVNSGKKMQAVVVEYMFDKVTIRLVGNGQVMRNLPLVGGPVATNDLVFVDFSTVPPTVYAKGNEYLSASDLQEALEKAGVTATSGDAKINIVLFSGGGVLAMYSPSVDGLGTALAAAQPGDLVWVSDIEIEGDFTVPAGVALVGISSRQSVIWGTVTLGTDSSLENISVIKAVYTNEEVNALIAQGAGDASWIKGCEIHSYNCGSGISRAVKVGAATGRIQFSNCVIVADANESSTASAFDGAGGTCFVNDCQVYSKSADHFNGTTFYIHNNITHVSEINRRCVPILSEDHQQNKFFPIADPHGFLPRLAPGSPTVTQFINEASGGWSSQHSHCKFEEYLYQDFTNGNGDRTIREVRTTDGQTKDVVVWSGAPLTIVGDRMIAVTKRELNVFNSDSTKGRVYKVNYETETSILAFEFDVVRDEGDPITGVGYKYYRDFYFLPVKGDDGNLYLIITGTWYEFKREDGTYGDVYTAGPFFWKKNWTTNGGWQRFEGPQFADDTVALDQFSSGMYITAVNSRYVVCSANLQFDNIAGNIAAIGMWSFDIVDEEIKQDIKIQIPKYGSFAPSPGYIANSELDNCAYLNYSGSDFEYSNNGFDVIYKYNPVTGSMTEYYRASGTQDFGALLVNKDQVYLYIVDGADTDFMELSGKTLVTETAANLPTGWVYFRQLNDSNEIVGYNKTTGLIWLYNITTDVATSIDVNLEADTTALTVNIYPLNGVYVITGTQYIGPGSNYTHKAWIVT